MWLTPKLENVQAGDKVVYHHYFVYGDANAYDLVTVDRVTKTQIIIGDTRFRRKDGYPVGKEAWSRSDRIYSDTLEARKQMDAVNEHNRKEQLRKSLYRVLSDVKWKNLDVDTLKAAHAALVEVGVVERESGS